jgi:hypothetical protein
MKWTRVLARGFFRSLRHAEDSRVQLPSLLPKTALFAAFALVAACSGAGVPATQTANGTANLQGSQKVHVTPTPAGKPSPVNAGSIRRAFDFNASIGANLHIETGGPYGNASSLSSMIAQTGVQHFRDSISVATANAAELSSLHASYGAQFDFITDPGQTVSSLVAAVNAVGIAATDAAEGDNECDVSGQPGCGGSTYPATEAANQQTLYTAMRAESATISVFGPSNTSEAAASAVGNLSMILDYGVTHDYTSWRPIETPGWGGSDACGTYGADSWALCWAGYVGVGKPTVSTETGWGDYATLDAAANGGDYEGLVPAAVKADYVGRLFAFHWIEGIARTYYFELADGLSSPGFSAHGLYDVNGVPKPAAFEVANLHSILLDGGPTAKTFTPLDAIGLSVTAPSGAYSTLLQKSNGSEYLLYWTGCEEYQGDLHVVETCATPTGTLTFAKKPSLVSNWVLNAAGNGEATNNTLSPLSSITLTFKPHLQIVQITP